MKFLHDLLGKIISDNTPGKIIGLETNNWFGIRVRGDQVFAYNELTELELFKRPDFAEFTRIIKEADIGLLRIEDIRSVTKIWEQPYNKFFVGKIGN
jgi:hypothetical protein